MIAARERLIVALDVSNARQARQILDAVGAGAGIFKIGKQLFTAEGPRLVRELTASGRKVFLDLKYHDIPNTVASAVAEAARLGVAMLTVHASGGSRMLRAATEAAAASESKPLVLGVTVLTSMSQAELAETGVPGPVDEQVLRLAALAVNAGGGIVCSALEAHLLRGKLGASFPIVTPGIRPAGAAKGDQTRVVTPAQALRNGATHIVVGRPITEAVDPAAAARAIVAELESC
jgi:orotidine-5'-phosphate decarboxylase